MLISIGLGAHALPEHNISELVYAGNNHLTDPKSILQHVRCDLLFGFATYDNISCVATLQQGAFACGGQT